MRLAAASRKVLQLRSQARCAQDDRALMVAANYPSPAPAPVPASHIGHRASCIPYPASLRPPLLDFPLALLPGAGFVPPCPKRSIPSAPTNSKPASAVCGGIFDLPGKQARLSELESLMAEPGFWDRKEQAQKQVEEVSALRARIGPLVALESQVSDLETLQLLADEETDPRPAGRRPRGLGRRVRPHPPATRRLRVAATPLRRK